MSRVGGLSAKSISQLLSNYIGETVTIFTKSGGQSGAGFTGVILSVNDCFVRLITRIGPPPGCALGNACTGFDVGNKYGKGIAPSGGGCGISGGYAAGYGKGYGPILPANENGAITAGGWNGYPVYTVGSVADIPVDSIVAFVHNAV
ncbi:MAG TPA: hypothetical protein DEF39_07115 [Hungateiclostridium thermocellum]|jgi:hypothetical protein|uniref:Uncharacterized protein n=2 Tax=Acetivibrio thermocellus TaxID=1515 RepID=A3DCL2_ACET2|nr:hypothetical protein [Acetivibrio thermocellus]CDG35167.1 hypothetical protein CTHBC1_0501 [Acetivibrio thermocellus BC1]ABN51691.1 hypothetical protein Cthe_0453 [Acetivibrio thermocellus ATCC 27405]ADU74824.1 hypothetical protein Clo1313_1767 [Acetivibrio thermocellus DSM 1313]ALX08777.1 hypothetical protein AD2_01787 [Acetivibrio thermocellus AD2]ANV76528.1 hypothetical protein LQRI_1787 [Acetivibrio thermocellus DSM 2360]